MLKVTGATSVYAILGDPVSHSMSPVMQNAAFMAAGIDAVYVPFHVTSANLADAVLGLRAINVCGVNVTIPHKEHICELLDELAGDAELIGAVNTIVNDNGLLRGYNTDGAGLVKSLDRDLGFVVEAGVKVVITGAGGAARGAVVALARGGVEQIVIANRTVARADALVERYRDVFPATEFIAVPLNSESVTPYVEKCDLIINSTSLGLSGESFNVLPWAALSADVVVYDMVYTAGGTSFMHQAEAAGCRTCGGLGMLVAQGELAFELWTGVKVGDAMYDAIYR